jgi:hypothetical protein
MPSLCTPLSNSGAGWEKKIFTYAQTICSSVSTVYFSQVLKLLPVIPNILPLQNAYKVRLTPVYNNKRNKKTVSYLLLHGEYCEIVFLENSWFSFLKGICLLFIGTMYFTIFFCGSKADFLYFLLSPQFIGHFRCSPFTRRTQLTRLSWPLSLKVYSSHLNWGARRDSFDPLLNTRCPASFKFFF